MFNGTTVVINCNGLKWSIGVGCSTGCGDPGAIAIGVEAGASSTNTCSCFPDFILRPNIGNASWGGYNTAGDNCNPVDQRLRIEFVFDSTVTQSNPSCSYTSDGTITPLVTGGYSPYTFAWSDLSTASTRTGLSGGIYNLTVTDNGGCTTTKTYDLSTPDSLQIQLSRSHPSSNVATDGYIIANVNGGVGP